MVSGRNGEAGVFVQENVVNLVIKSEIVCVPILSRLTGEYT